MDLAGEAQDSTSSRTRSPDQNRNAESRTPEGSPHPTISNPTCPNLPLAAAELSPA